MSVHFEIEDQDPEGEGLARRRGHSRNGRRDAAQVVVGLAVTRDGFHVRHRVFSGNTVDVSTVGKVREDLRGWRLTRCVFVGDAGMVSKENLQTLSRGGGRYNRLGAGAAGGEDRHQGPGLPWPLPGGGAESPGQGGGARRR